MRKPLAIVLAIVIVAVVAALGVDFLQIGRKAPELAASEDRADLIRVDKAKHTLTLLRGDNVIKVYQVSLGSSPLGHKSREGDGRTPEGRYTIDSRNSRSRFHLALHISYPSAADRADAERRHQPPGSDIMIHGLRNGLGWLNRWHLKRDWTDGCVAVTNSEIEEIWSHIATGTPVEIVP